MTAQTRNILKLLAKRNHFIWWVDCSNGHMTPMLVGEKDLIQRITRPMINRLVKKGLIVGSNHRRNRLFAEFYDISPLGRQHVEKWRRRESRLTKMKAETYGKG